MADQVYGPERSERLIDLLRTFAVRVMELDDQGLLAAGPQLLKQIGDIRSELFHYEVRCTYDTPETADHRRIVEQARHADPIGLDDDEDGAPWRHQTD